MHAGQFESEGFTVLFAMLQKEFSDEYFASIQNHLTELKFRAGILLSAELGKGNEGTNYVLREGATKDRTGSSGSLAKGRLVTPFASTNATRLARGPSRSCETAESTWSRMRSLSLSITS